MQLQRIGTSVVALMIDGEELRRRNITADEIDERQAASLLEPTGWHGAQFELYAGKDCVLLFAWESDDIPNLFEFETLEDLLGGAGCCPNCASELIYYGGAYILVIYTARNEEPCARLYEFGQPRYAAESFVTHMEEQGKVLAASNAVGKLKTLLL